MLNFLGSTGGVLAPKDIRGAVGEKVRSELGIQTPVSGLPPMSGGAAVPDVNEQFATEVDALPSIDEKLNLADTYRQKGMSDEDVQRWRNMLLQIYPSPSTPKTPR
jgi:hypothetical protein